MVVERVIFRSVSLNDTSKRNGPCLKTVPSPHQCSNMISLADLLVIQKGFNSVVFVKITSMVT